MKPDRSASPSGGRHGRPASVRRQSAVDQGDDSVDGRMAQTLLPGQQLHELVRAFDIECAAVECAGCRRIFVLASLAKPATLKLVGSVTCRMLTFSPCGRTACGSGLHSVRVPGSKFCQTPGSV